MIHASDKMQGTPLMAKKLNDLMTSWLSLEALMQCSRKNFHLEKILERATYLREIG